MKKPHLVIVRYKSGTVNTFTSRARTVRVKNAEDVVSIDFVPLD